MNLEEMNGWEKSFNDYSGYSGNFFQRRETRHSARLYLRGLLSDIPRKNGWQVAEHMGLEQPLPVQRLLNENNTRRDADLVGYHL